MQLNSKVDEFEQISILLHHVIFSYEQAYDKLVGTGSKAVHQELMRGFSNTFEFGDIGYISKSGSLDENMQSYIENLKSSKYFDDVMFDYQNESYVFEVKECKFAKKKTHIFLTNKHTCPFAVLAASIIYNSTNENLRIHKTEFDEHGGRTVIERIKM